MSFFPFLAFVEHSASSSPRLLFSPPSPRPERRGTALHIDGRKARKGKRGKERRLHPAPSSSPSFPEPSARDEQEGERLASSPSTPLSPCRKPPTSLAPPATASFCAASFSSPSLFTRSLRSLPPFSSSSFSRSLALPSTAPEWRKEALRGVGVLASLTSGQMTTREYEEAFLPRRLKRIKVFNTPPPSELPAFFHKRLDNAHSNPRSILKLYRQYMRKDDYPAYDWLVRCFCHLGNVFGFNSFWATKDKQVIQALPSFKFLVYDLIERKHLIEARQVPRLLYAFACLEYRSWHLLPTLLEHVEANLEKWRTPTLANMALTLALLGVGDDAPGEARRMQRKGKPCWRAQADCDVSDRWSQPRDTLELSKDGDQTDAEEERVGSLSSGKGRPGLGNEGVTERKKKEERCTEREGVLCVARPQEATAESERPVSRRKHEPLLHLSHGQAQRCLRHLFTNLNQKPGDGSSPSHPSGRSLSPSDGEVQRELEVSAWRLLPAAQS
ncbi:hypothetical protein TGRUB_267040A [Toxoplasma gondii RUB]|uniref:DUF6832 domain-containing protein n=1 Tax=Toxoplasma gondii RUB TaxID=935652 RepID=A0A086LQG9_TOXGO|nr:hypothetical protein TGRUB_267040A [Toxoplasma gondii RUB]